MRTPKVRLYVRVRLKDGKYSHQDPVFNKNRSLRAAYAVVNGKPEHHPEAIYYLRFLRGQRRVWQAIGADADAALVALRNQEHDLQSVCLGRSAPVPATQEEAPAALSEAIAAYLAEVRLFRSAKTIAACERILGVFGRRFPQHTLASLRREDLLCHMAELKQGGLAPRTIYNHAMRIKTFLRSRGIAALLKPGDIPTYDEPEVEAYDAGQLDSLFAAANAEERLLFQFFLATGFRDQEVRYCTWRNVDFEGRVISVRSKPELGFRPKDKEERSVPVPDALIALLEDSKRVSKSLFVFPGKNGKPDSHFLRTVQRLAYRADLNCGECVNKKKRSCQDRAICGRWGLHKFRKTFATMHSDAGVPAPTIQRWLGHSDLATTLRYLALADIRSEKTRTQVNSTFAGLNVNRLSGGRSPQDEGSPAEIRTIISQDPQVPTRATGQVLDSNENARFSSA